MNKLSRKDLRSRAIKSVSGELREQRLNPADYDGAYAFAVLGKICRNEPALEVAAWYRDTDTEKSNSQLKLFIREWNRYHGRSHKKRRVIY